MLAAPGYHWSEQYSIGHINRELLPRFQPHEFDHSANVIGMRIARRRPADGERSQTFRYWCLLELSLAPHRFFLPSIEPEKPRDQPAQMAPQRRGGGNPKQL